MMSRKFLLKGTRAHKRRFHDRPTLPDLKKA